MLFDEPSRKLFGQDVAFNKISDNWELNVCENKESKDVSQKSVFVSVTPGEDKEGERHESGVQKISEEVFNDHDSVLAGQGVSFLPFCQSFNNFFQDKVDKTDSSREDERNDARAEDTVEVLKSNDDSGKGETSSQNNKGQNCAYDDSAQPFT